MPRRKIYRENVPAFANSRDAVCQGQTLVGLSNFRFSFSEKATAVAVWPRAARRCQEIRAR
jgi:hypothetical protein